MTATFLPGLDLSAAFYRELIGPLLAGRPHSAALLGFGSDVLGYDTARSTGHGWGPRLQVFVPGGSTADDDIAAILGLVDRGLPASFRGWPTRYGWDAVAVQHHVTVTTLGDWLIGQLGFDPRIVADRQVGELMRLAFLLERRYWPYSKWFGTGFGRLRCAAELQPLLAEVTAAPDHRSREAALVLAYESVARQHNSAAITGPAEPTVRLFHDRPFRVLDSGRFVQACLAEVFDEWLRGLPLIGGVDQFVDSTDVTSKPPTVQLL
ncbi:MAG: DUF4037 domain-containing protein, partial [Actinomycetota bacterium]|nr:DUF4037 domain-containing protein [Actinomycetota bacterium]